MENGDLVFNLICKVIKVCDVCEVVCKVCDESRNGKKLKKDKGLFFGKLIFV